MEKEKEENENGEEETGEDYKESDTNVVGSHLIPVSVQHSVLFNFSASFSVLLFRTSCLFVFVCLSA